MMSNEFFKCEFLKKSKEINTMEELLKLFSDITADETNLIMFDSCVAIKHAATGKYLSSVSNLYYKTGTKDQAVFAGETLPEPNTLWIITSGSQSTREPPYNNFVFYDEEINLTHKMTDVYLSCSHNCHSPLSKYSEIFCYTLYGSSFSIDWKLKHYKTTNNCGTYVKSQDKIILQNDKHNKILRSHELEFDLNNKTYQEVVGHDERIGGNDEVYCNIISNLVCINV
ncbi:hypothetical protein C1645_781940 [Glomus cerebriforme]|uniref:MIR domain-containing protein n=1 Tax=Glomus cerebriforme TaxID=658196 RepID=A0A397SKH4_9GLOM|nr:hypothetical protein C1645_781940 [Glomus cerebriforme]